MSASTMGKRGAKVLVFGVLLVGIWVASFFIVGSVDSYNTQGDLLSVETRKEELTSTWEGKGQLRHLTALPNCTPRAIEQFPMGLFSQGQRRHGMVGIHIFAAFYMFLAFALICDDYFVPSLELLSEVLQIQPDVAGSTFMAAGSSAPELATAIIAVFIAKDDIGLGAVVGSAVYNVMFVISICALFAGMVVHLCWWPLVRDSAFYMMSVVALALVIMDENVYWYEAFVLVVMYIFYILIMYYNTSLEQWFLPKFVCPSSGAKPLPSETVVLYDKLRDTDANMNGAISSNGKEVVKINMSESTPPVSDSESEFDPGEGHLIKKATKAADKDEEPESVFACPEGCCKQCIWFISLPMKVLLFISIPDCRYKRWQKWYLVTFVMSLVWLSLCSYLMVWMITVIGYTLDIPDSIMALTFVAFGVSLPDVMASLIVVREGQGDMAISNAVGSNVFDILVCLGVPWLLQTAVHQGEPVQVYSGGLIYSVLTLMVTVVILIVATHVNGWRLTKKYGVCLMFVYILFTILTSLYELNLFGFVHPLECPSNY